MNYEFNPEDYGYKHVSKFPELLQFFGNTTYIKIIAVGGSEYGRRVYWYSYCYAIGCDGDQRKKIGSSSFDESRPSEFNSRTTYSGLISTDDFAKQLLMHIFGTTQNKGVLKEGKERLENIIEY